MIKTEKQTLGELFQEVRKERGVSIDEIVRDTNIPKRYLESIESDNFDIFPGETYAMGFVANYADAMEIDRDLAISMYKRQMKIEQDSPIEQLVGRKKDFQVNNNLILIGGGVLAVVLIIVIGLALRSGGSKDTKNNTPVNYSFIMDDTAKIANQRFKIGDTLTLSNESKLIMIYFDSIGPSRSLNLKVNTSPYSLKNNELLSVDSDNNGTNDLGIELYNAKEKDIKLAVTPLKELGDSASLSTQDEVYNKYKEYILSENEFITATSKAPVTMKVTSAANGWIGYLIDNKEEKGSYLNNGTTLSISFVNNLILYLGNSGAVRINIGGKEESGGGWGEVGKSVFYWKSKNNQFALVRAILK